jgi:2'-hydroxyisoflavone reductase
VVKWISCGPPKATSQVRFLPVAPSPQRAAQGHHHRTTTSRTDQPPGTTAQAQNPGMKVLVLGGTRFLGLHIVEELVKAGHGVTVFNRGLSPAALPAAVVRLRGDRDGGPEGLAALKGGRWDLCIDVSGYTARQVRASTGMLRPAVAHYVFISAASVYGDPRQRPVVETHPRVPPAAEDVVEIDGTTYGPLKVCCENIVAQAFGGKCTLLRPQIVVGPGDDWNRYTDWVQRAMHEGCMLAPGDGSDHLQVIDVRDLARFVRRVAEAPLHGTFNLAGPRLTWAAFMAILGAGPIVWVPTAIIERTGLSSDELPLFRPEHGARAGLMDVSSERARAAGLTWTDPALTARDVRAWCMGQRRAPALSPQREAELLHLARQGGT